MRGTTPYRKMLSWQWACPCCAYIQHGLCTNNHASPASVGAGISAGVDRRSSCWTHSWNVVSYLNCSSLRAVVVNPPYASKCHSINRSHKWNLDSSVSSTLHHSLFNFFRHNAHNTWYTKFRRGRSPPLERFSNTGRLHFDSAKCEWKHETDWIFRELFTFCFSLLLESGFFFSGFLQTLFQMYRGIPSQCTNSSIIASCIKWATFLRADVHRFLNSIDYNTTTVLYSTVLTSYIQCICW